MGGAVEDWVMILPTHSARSNSFVHGIHDTSPGNLSKYLQQEKNGIMKL